MNFKEELKKLNIELTEEASFKFDAYYKRLVAVNEVMNLTAITEHDEVYNKHFLDSLMIVRALDLSKEFTLCDVGSGAGFPSIPLAIVSSNAKVTIIDALNKRIKFLNDLVGELGLTNVLALHQRAEDFAKEKRESFDYVTARAVARLNVLSELCLPLVRVGGSFIAMKGQGGKDELEEAKKAIDTLGGKLEKVISLELPDNAGARDILIIKKIKETPKKYPRAFAKIKERPL
ncbi:16S rRNA (guanine527-N7)-methyltransferase [Anaeroplasma bactoclasticum]|jgi:16S rRNA (guanine527-N7)-methyltransferase|uniref:Ribosomal RNA small subunit methyltransferase G n=1 Tax=Anaeroplasma bactoclasticum TaxID=2088 RepID=A0A397RTB5_9MOLU|nr:16S rRNA (guanine(527)-N(7))-methyltransferase RsmG [Anaeroplasma bactoclasticum]RIA75659.1 16S rRNA (guanine527-N7)-methyltransferase [Anaeroplasma bactoclasticum]